MKSIAIGSALLLILLPIQLFSQDTLLLHDNSKIGCTVQSIGNRYIEYTRFKDDDGVYYRVSRNLVQYIIYNSGTIDTINPIRPAAVLPAIGDSTVSIPYTNSFDKGREDALRLYRHPAAGIANGFAGLLLGYGIPSPIIWSLVKVNPANISNPEYVTSGDTEYRRGFEKGASQKMHRQAWKSYGIGAGVSGVAIVALFIYTIAYF